MNNAKRGLGRGIGALIPGKKNSSIETLSGADNTDALEKVTTADEATETPQQDYSAGKGASFMEGGASGTSGSGALAEPLAEPDPADDDIARGVQELPIEKVRANPNQPRKTFDEAALNELAESIRHYGILQPLLVNAVPGGYEIIAGERRYRAAKLAGLTTVPALVRDFTPEEKSVVALIENVQREDLNPMEEARAYHELMVAFGLTQDQLAQKIGRSRSHIANITRLLRLPQRVQDSLSDEAATMGQVKPLLALDDKDLMQKAADYIIDHELPAREAEQFVSRLKKNPKMLDPRTKVITTERVIESDIEERLRMILGTKVKLVMGERKNKIEIEFYDQDDLNRISDILTKSHDDAIAAKKKMLREVSWKFTT